MWISGDVDLPDDLLQAHADGTLVIFAGAGVSVAAPSNLPLFAALAQQLGVLARRPYESGAIDRFLGELSRDFDVHAHVREIIADDTSQPNALHLALAKLASAHGMPRIVTTNFDDHIARTAKAAGVDLGETYFAPALPVGRDFVGLVHLHGSVQRRSKDLVVTDRDFGRAYLTDAWATRFLREMFLRYTVLFVGYSHDDPIVNYLGLGLPSNTRRFIFTPSRQEERWERLGITPIAYPSDNNHVALVHALERWAEQESTGVLARLARVRDLAAGTPPKAPDDADFLRHQLASQQAARAFAAVARGAEWIDWLAGLPAFDGNFKPNLNETEASRELGRWFCDSFLAVRDGQAAAFDFFQRTGQTLSNSMHQRALWSARQLAEVDEAAGQRLVVFLMSSIRGQTAAPSYSEALQLHDNATSSLKLFLLQKAMQPHLLLKKNFFADVLAEASVMPQVEVDWPVDLYSLKTFLEGARPEIGESSRLFAAVFEGALSISYTLLSTFSGKPEPFDPLSWGRSAIEPHSQDSHEEIIDLIIDELRDYGISEIDAGRLEVIEEWGKRQGSVFKRLATYLLNHSTGFTVTEKLSWLLEHNMLYDLSVKHEAYSLIASIAPQLDDMDKSLLLQRVDTDSESLAEGLSNSDQLGDYMRYNLLHWLAVSDPSWAEAARRSKGLEEQHGFAPREHPDFDHWMESGIWGGTLPMALEELKQLVFNKGATAAVLALVKRDYSERNFGEPTWDDALRLASMASADDAQVGIDLFDASNALPKEKADPLRGAFIEGWVTAEIQDSVEAVLERVSADPLLAPRQTGRLLREQLRVNGSSFTDQTITHMQELARQLWRAGSEEFSHGSHDEPGYLSLNSWPADLATFWILCISRRWAIEEEDWSGLSETESAALQELLHGPQQASEAAIAAIGGELPFLSGADMLFTQATVLPLFDDPESGYWAWGTYLFNPRWNNRLLQCGFLSSVLKVLHRADILTQTKRAQFFVLVVGILSYADLGDAEKDELIDSIVLIDGGRLMPQMIQQAAHLIRTSPEEVVDFWARWVQRTLQRRFRGEPREPSADEVQGWSNLVPALSPNMAELKGLLDLRVVPFDASFPPFVLPDALDSAGASLLVDHLGQRLAATPVPIPASSARHLSNLVKVIQDRFGQDLGDALQEELRAHGPFHFHQ